MRRAICIAFVSLFFLVDDFATAQTTVLREGTERLLQATARFFAKAGTREIGQELAEYGGETFVRNLAQRLVREGGEEALEKAVALTGKYGPDVLRAVDNAPSPTTLLRALDDIPTDQVGPAIRRLSAGPQGKTLASLVDRHGANVLRTEIAHPGVGVRLVQNLGNDGIRLSQRLGREEAITVARHAEDIAMLPGDQKSNVLRLLYEDTKRMVEFMGRFVERNPGKTLFTAATTAIILADAERVLGGDDIIIDKDGNPQVVSKPGLLGRTVETTATNLLRPILNVLLPLIAIGVGAWIGIKLWFAYRLNRLKLTHAEQSGALKNGLTNRSTGAAKSRDLPIESQSSSLGDR